MYQWLTTGYSKLNCGWIHYAVQNSPHTVERADWEKDLIFSGVVVKVGSHLLHLF